MNGEKFIKAIIKKFGGTIGHIAGWKLHNKKCVSDFDDYFGTDFSCKYDIPFNWTSDHIWFAVNCYYWGTFTNVQKEKYKKFLYEKLYKPIAAKYPKLQGLDNNFIDVLMGVGSEFAPEDIRAFCVEGVFCYRPITYQMKVRELEAKINYQIQFVPSEDTLKKMYDHFELKMAS